MAVDRTRLPEPGPPLSFNFPEVRRRTLANGLRVCTIEHHEVPLVTCFVLMPIGSSQDPGHQPGLAAITGDLLDEGSGDLDALAVHEALGRIGAHLDTEIGADATLLELTTLERYAPRALELLASMVRNPRLDPRDFDRVRELRLNRLVQLRDLPPAVADRVFTQLLYPEHPYGHLPIGTEEALRALTIADVTTFHRRAYTPKNATVIAVGDASHDRLAALVAAAFGEWAQPGGRRHDPVDVAALDAPPSPAGRVVAVHRTGAAQSELRMGHIGLARSTPDYHALLVMNMILGGQFVSRINMNLREEKGYTYGARTSVRVPEGPRAVRLPDERAVGRDGRGCPGSPRRDKGHSRRPAGHRRRAGARPCRADTRVSAQLRNSRTTRTRCRAARALRPPRRLLHHVRSAGPGHRRATTSRASPRSISLRSDS